MLKFWTFFIQYLTVLLLLCTYKTATAVYYPISYHIPMHRTLYLDRQFDLLDTIKITRAAHRWSRATNNMVTFDIVSLPTDINTINYSEAIIVIAISPDYPEAILMDRDNKNTTLAYFDRSAKIPTLAFIYERVDEEMFEKVALHELGHAIGLEHVVGDEGLGQVMYPLANLMGNNITHQDLEQFCHIYFCDVNKLHEETYSL